MLKKAAAVILLFTTLLISGCAATGSIYPEQTEKPEPAKPAEAMAGLQEIVDTSYKIESQVSDTKELHDLKVSTQQYYAGNTATGSQNTGKTGTRATTSTYETANIQLVTEDELSLAIRHFVEMGYMSQGSLSQEAFLAAVKKFQLDQGLSPTGQLDAPTRMALNGEKR